MSSDFVTIARFNDPANAERARGRLAGVGIPSLLTEREKVTVRWHSAELADAEIQLLVSPDDEDRAVELLNSESAPVPVAIAGDQNSEAIAGQPNLAGSPTAANDDSAPDIVSSRDGLVDRAYKAQVISFLFWPLQLYSLYCIATVSRSQLPLQETSRRKYTTTLILHGVLWAFLGMVYLMNLKMRS